MEAAEEARANIWQEIASDDPEVRKAFLARYEQQAERFATGMAAAFLAWFRRDASCEGRYVSSAAVAVCASSNSANLSAVTGLLK